MSVAFTEQAVRDRTKTVTRRKGWTFVKPGDTLTLCRKVMGRKPGDPLVRICDVVVVAVRREPLHMIEQPGELAREGFPDLTPRQFIGRYFHPQKVYRDDLVTRIEWRYLPAPSPGGVTDTADTGATISTNNIDNHAQEEHPDDGA